MKSKIVGFVAIIITVVLIGVAWVVLMGVPTKEGETPGPGKFAMGLKEPPDVIVNTLFFGEETELVTGENHFEYGRYFGATYDIIVTSSAVVQCTVNGLTPERNGNTFTYYLDKLESQDERQHQIVLTVGENAQDSTVKLDFHNRDLSNFVVPAKKSEVIGFQTDTPTVVTFASLNDNITILSILEKKRYGLWEYSMDSEAIIETDRLDMPLTTGKKYILVKNSASSEQTGRITVEDVPELELGEQPITINTNRRYYKFQVSTEGSFTFQLALKGVSINANIRYADFQNAVTSYVSSGLLTIYDVPENKTLWVGLSGDVEKNGTVEVNEIDNPYQWRVDGKIIKGQHVALKPGTYDIALWYEGKQYNIVKADIDLPWVDMPSQGDESKVLQILEEGKIIIFDTSSYPKERINVYIFAYKIQDFALFPYFLKITFL